MRDNLDPGHVHDDTELWSVLGKPRVGTITFNTDEFDTDDGTDQARLKEHVASMAGKLDAKIREGGT